ncbi:MAG: CHAP domain-containing protein, partial [Hungatella sp.]|nr:CHAP domain-containing protein [Hungatella sp.]
KNYTKYARDVNAAGLMGCQGQPWCCTFQFWLEMQEFGVEQALKHWNMPRSSYVGYNCFATYNVFKKAGKVGMTPRLGAVVIFDFSHAGRVVGIYSRGGQKWWDCLEGNTSSNLSDRNGGQVKVKTRPWNDPSVKGFCYIDYDEEYQEGFTRAADGKRWWYQYKDGTYPTGWAYLKEKTGGTYGWYLFDKAGYMLTGYQTAQNGKKYFLCPEPGIYEGQCMVTNDQGELIIVGYDIVNRRYF